MVLVNEYRIIVNQNDRSDILTRIVSLAVQCPNCNAHITHNIEYLSELKCELCKEEIYLDVERDDFDKAILKAKVEYDFFLLDRGDMNE